MYVTSYLIGVMYFFCIISHEFCHVNFCHIAKKTLSEETIRYFLSQIGTY